MPRIAMISPRHATGELARAYRDVKAGSFMHPLGADRAYDYLAHLALDEQPTLH